MFFSFTLLELKISNRSLFFSWQDMDVDNLRHSRQAALNGRDWKWDNTFWKDAYIALPSFGLSDSRGYSTLSTPETWLWEYMADAMQCSL